MSQTMPTVRLKFRKDVPVRAGHPWIFSNALDAADTAMPGALVRVMSHTGDALGIGMINPANTIRVRMITNKPDAVIDEHFFAERLRALDEQKKKLIPADTTGYRMVHADADGLPGLIVDRYDDVLVFQIHTVGMDRLRDAVVAALTAVFKPRAIAERSDIESRKQEGLRPVDPRVHYGIVDGAVKFKECGLTFFADVMTGQKTGFFLDQRTTRMRVQSLARGKKVLNLFGYTGAFVVYAVKGGASSVTSVDVSEDVIALGRAHLESNGINADDGHTAFVTADVFDYINEKGREAEARDMIVCDPPAFAKSRAHAEQAVDAYVALNVRCLSLLKEDGILVTSSCSGSVNTDEFRNALRIAAGIAKRDVRVLDFLGQPADHTEKLVFGEGRYLKTAVLQVIRAW